MSQHYDSAPCAGKQPRNRGQLKPRRLEPNIFDDGDEIRRPCADQSTNSKGNGLAAYLRRLVRPGEIVQLFIKGTSVGRHQLLVGYYDREHLDWLEAHVAVHDGHSCGIYHSLNPVDPSLLRQAENCLRPAGEAGLAKDVDIVRRHLLLVDVDPKRDGSVSATRDEKDHAREKVREVKRFLMEQGWPSPIRIDSGNGFHLIYGIDVNADDKNLVRDVLRALALRFDDDRVTIDTTVFNPARITKLPGTMACKGEPTAERPHRKSRVLKFPYPLVPVSEEQLQAVASMLPTELPVKGPVDTPCRVVADSQVIEQARAYLAKMPPAVSGNHGRDQCLNAACRLVDDFALSAEAARPLLEEYNQRCEPPFNRTELQDKLDSAIAKVTRRGGPSGRGLRAAGESLDLEPLDGAEFHGYVPDFGLAAAVDVLCSIDNFVEGDLVFWVRLWLLWAKLTPDVRIPDVFLRQCWRGAHHPQAWRRALELSAQDLDDKCGPSCLFHGLAVKHHHIVLADDSEETQVTDWMELAQQADDDDEDAADRLLSAAERLKLEDDEELVWSFMAIAITKSINATRRAKYGLLCQFLDQDEDGRPRFDLFGQNHAEKLKEYRKAGIVTNVYWPALLFGQAVDWTYGQQRLLVGIVHELTRERRRPGEELRGAEVVGNRVVTPGRGTHLVVCPDLNPQGRYVTFGGNGKRPGRGYQIIGRTGKGWLWRAGSHLPIHKMKPRARLQGIARLLDDLQQLAHDLGLIVVAHGSGGWKNLDEMLDCLENGRGQDWLEAATLRIYAPADWQTRWRHWFSQQLGFRWIPACPGDEGPRSAVLLPNPRRITTASQIKRALAERGWTQQHLADQIAKVTGKPCSLRRVLRHIHGDSQTQAFFEAVNAALECEM